MSALPAKTGHTAWTADELPALTGKTFVITGGNSGIGFEAAKRLSIAGGHVIIAARSADKAAAAMADIQKVGRGDVSTVALDLSRLSSVRDAATAIADKAPKIDALICNAGVMQTPKSKTEDGFELQLGTNHLGHFLLASLLYPNVLAVEGRIVSVASLAHKFGKIDFNDLMLETSYGPSKAYCQSKLANILFTMGLHRRLANAGSPVMAVACHPGYSDTNLQFSSPLGIWPKIYRFTNNLMAQSAADGALPTLLAAAGHGIVSGAYLGPQKFNEMRGPAGDAKVSSRGQDPALADRLWTESERLVGHSWSI